MADKAHGGTLSNGLHVATASGKRLSGDPAQGLERYRKLPEAERRRLTDLGPTDPKLDRQPPPGCLVLDVWSRALADDGPGQLAAYRNAKAHLTGEPSRDHLWIPEEEWKALAPVRDGREKRPGEAVPVPEPLADRIARFCLVDQIRIGGNGNGRRREDVLSRGLKLTVEGKAGPVIRMRLEGSAAFAQHDDLDKVPRVRFDLLGFLEYDPARAAFTRFEVVAVGDDAHFDECAAVNTPLGVCLRLTPAAEPIDRVWPAFYEDPGYFGGGKK